jgi:hypothetical protein
MDPQFEQHERELDRQLADLAPHLDAPVPRSGLIAQVKSAVDAEARRLRRRNRRIVALRPWIGAAAAVLLTVGLSLPIGSDGHRVPFNLGPSSAIAFNDWVDALDETGQRFTALLGDEWLFETPGSGDNQGNGAGDPLDSLEESLESFERIIGA